MVTRKFSVSSKVPKYGTTKFPGKSFQIKKFLEKNPVIDENACTGTKKICKETTIVG